MTTSRPLHELLGLDPRPSPDRERGALAERHHHRLGRPQREALLGDVGEQVIGLVELACQPVREREKQQSGRPELAPAGERPDRKFRICAHPGDPSSATHRTEQGQPRIDRSAAVIQRAVVARAFGHLGPTLRLRRPALNRGDERAEHRDRRVPVERSMPLQPVEPALDGRDATALVHRLSPTLDQPRDPGDVPCFLRVPDRRLRLPVRLTPVGGANEEAGDKVRLGSDQLRSEQLLEEMVVAVPLSIAVQRHQEQVGARQRLQNLARSRSLRGPRRRAVRTSVRERRSASGSERSSGDRCASNSDCR